MFPVLFIEEERVGLAPPNKALKKEMTHLREHLSRMAHFYEKNTPKLRANATDICVIVKVSGSEPRLTPTAGGSDDTLTLRIISRTKAHARQTSS
jgi:hypothetical protein